MTDDEILEELAKLSQQQQQFTKTIWQQARSMRVCWICGDNEANERELNSVRGYLCQNCYSIQTRM